MLKFVDKQGNKVMELHDNGEVNILNEKLKKSFSETPEKEKEQEDAENE